MTNLCDDHPTPRDDAPFLRTMFTISRNLNVPMAAVMLAVQLNKDIRPTHSVDGNPVFDEHGEARVLCECNKNLARSTLTDDGLSQLQVSIERLLKTVSPLLGESGQERDELDQLLAGMDRLLTGLDQHRAELNRLLEEARNNDA